MHSRVCQLWLDPPEFDMLVSIFNDVIGPVMRGASSSHCAAALRIGKLARDLMEGDLQEVLVQFDRHGALATTHASQGSDMGLFAGLLGWEADDSRLPDSPRAIRDAGVQVRIEIAELHDPHPSTYRLTLRGATGQHSLRAVSTGGGMIEIIDIDGFPVSIAGDYWETLIWTEMTGPHSIIEQSAAEAEGIVDSPNVRAPMAHDPAFDAHRYEHPVAVQLAEVFDADEILVHEKGAGQLVEVKARQFVSEAAIASLSAVEGIRVVQSVRRLAPVLPVTSRKNVAVPFGTCAEMLRHDADRDLPLWKLAVEYETARSDLSDDEVLRRMTDIVQILRRSIQQGIDGTQYQDRILGHQSGVFKSRMEAARLIDAGVLNRIVLYVSALMEVKSSMGVIVAAPTAGACAALPGACVAVADEMNLPDEVAAKAMLAAGLVGVFIAKRSTLSAEVAGCQAECGVAACMAAAALVTLADGNTCQALAAASMALQNSLGMICDPVASRVEVPCLGKNVLAASNALACANMAMADYDAVISLDEVIEAADRVGRSLPRELRCTALGGLSTTDASRGIEKRLAGRKAGGCERPCDCGK